MADQPLQPDTRASKAGEKKRRGEERRGRPHPRCPRGTPKDTTQMATQLNETYMPGQSLTTRAQRVPRRTRTNTPCAHLHRSHFSLFCEDRNDTRQRTLSAHSAAMFSSDGTSPMGIGYGTAAHAESGAAAQGGASVEVERNSPEVMSGDLSMGPTPDATVATPSAAGAASAEGAPSYGAFPLSAELAQVLEQGLTPEEEHQDSAQRRAASRTPPRRGRGRPKVHSAPPASRSAQTSRGRPRREDEDVQERQQRRRKGGDWVGTTQRASSTRRRDPVRTTAPEAPVHARRVAGTRTRPARRGGTATAPKAPVRARRVTRTRTRPAATKRSWKNGNSEDAAQREEKPQNRCAPPSCDAEPWTTERKHAVPRRDAKDAAGGETACDGRTPGRGRCSPTRTGRCAPCGTSRTRR